MANPAHIAAHVGDAPVSSNAPSTSHNDTDETIEYTANRQRIIVAGKCARAEQERLEKELGLQNGRTPRPG